MLLADLHMHTTASDGTLVPSQVVARAKALALDVIAITDHDTLGGVKEAIAQGEALGVHVLCGVELSAGDDGETHVLGYGEVENAPLINALFAKMHQDRRTRMLIMVDKLNALGFKMDAEVIERSAKGTLGRPHIAREMARLKYVSDVQDAFARYLGAGCPAYVPREPLPVSEAIAWLKAAHFVPVLAHPGLMHMEESVFLPLLDTWQKAGLCGVEVYHTANEQERGCAYYERVARTRGLLVTGGSDYHDDLGQNALGVMARQWHTAKEDLDALLSSMRQT